MPDITAGQVTALFLYEAAEVIDLPAVARLIAPTAQARLSTKAATPSYVQYREPPLTIDGDAIGLSDAMGFDPPQSRLRRDPVALCDRCRRHG
jgi:hypothetical protein